MTLDPINSRKAIELDITNDQLAEGDEMINLQLSSFSSAVRIGQQTTMITIQDNDSEPSLHAILI